MAFWAPMDGGRYQWLFRHSPAFLGSIDGEGRFVDLSGAFLRRLGYTRDELVGRRPQDISTPETAARLTEDILPRFLRAGVLDHTPLQYRTKDGEIVELLISSVAERDDDGRLLRSVAIFTETTEAAKLERQFRDLYRTTPAGLLTLCPGGRIHEVTDAWLSWFGYERKEVVGAKLTDFMPPSARDKLEGNYYDRLVEEGIIHHEPFELLTKSGVLVEALLCARVERDPQGQVRRVLCALQDVTELNRARREMQRALEEVERLREELERERDYLREEVSTALHFGEIIGESPALRRVLAQIDAVAKTPASVLILGESGVGKELVARAIHARSPRAQGPLVKVNCASIPRELFESEFFGHVRGAFTGAHKDRVGRFELADGGTIFLDEVGEIPLELQAKLLRVLQEQELERIGDDRTRQVDVRVLAATNRDLKGEVDAGNFREDLYYRLSVFPVEVPPLRERPEDIAPLARHFLARSCQEMGRPVLDLDDREVARMAAYDWPGNIRELQNVLERAVILSGAKLELDLPERSVRVPTRSPKAMPDEVPGNGFIPVEEWKRRERDNIIAALDAADWKISGKGGAADLLGVKPSTLSSQMKSLDIHRPEP